ncbi:hypothetical protein VVMO6_01416 [Vibrio vulnificus MO6-24/O]|nr:hypothetical protein VVMO6_01416 [Vibrio vulnificus MO6-24/O]
MAKIQNWYRFISWFFFGAAGLRFTEPNIIAEILLCEFAVAKASLLAEMTFSLVV